LNHGRPLARENPTSDKRDAATATKRRRYGRVARRL